MEYYETCAGRGAIACWFDFVGVGDYHPVPMLSILIASIMTGYKGASQATLAYAEKDRMKIDRVLVL